MAWQKVQQERGRQREGYKAGIEMRGEGRVAGRWGCLEKEKPSQDRRIRREGKGRQRKAVSTELAPLFMVGRKRGQGMCVEVETGGSVVCHALLPSILLFQSCFSREKKRWMVEKR